MYSAIKNNRGHASGSCFLVRVRVRNRLNSAEKHTVACRVHGVSSSTEAIDLFCAMNTIYVLHSTDYVLDCFTAKEIQ